ncbi:MAG TPA: hypothetical protein VHQ68_13415, partial [Propionibacteriaceae bacterium]|nr:hypothetical protein [Propionibacteriaceae bacterium]
MSAAPGFPVLGVRIDTATGASIMVTHLSDDATRMRASSALPIARNTALLSACLAAHSAMLQLAAAVASITLIGVLDVAWLLGLGPAIVLTAGALAALPAGRSMDR